jgi:hypothetical protein
MAGSHTEQRLHVIQRVVRKGVLDTVSEARENLAYWLTRTPAERVEAVELLRRRMHGSAARLQRVARVVERPCR